MFEDKINSLFRQIHGKSLFDEYDVADSGEYHVRLCNDIGEIGVIYDRVSDTYDVKLFRADEIINHRGLFFDGVIDFLGR